MNVEDFQVWRVKGEKRKENEYGPDYKINLETHHYQDTEPNTIVLSLTKKMLRDFIIELTRLTELQD